MSLSSGSRLGPYEIISALGAGGMGEVYRARDPKLNRDVALKILPEAFTLDGDRIARFRREAQVLASLNHPNIAAIYGFEDSGSTHALVLELVEGPTLADRIAQGAVPLDEALPIARQIAEALEAAHEQGIIHRDLKPANIKVTRDDKVKVLDFGLAKMLETGDAAQTGRAGAQQLTNSPTITTPAMMTGVGMILGTAAYMSPEQAKGLAADHRSDVFSFGCVLYEMLIGRQAFQGETTAEVLASILAREPDYDTLPSNLNPRLRELLQRCFEKQPRRRWQAIGDVRVELDIIAQNPHLLSPSSISAKRRMKTWYLVGAVTIAFAAALAAFITGARLNRTSVPDVVRLSIPLGEALRLPGAIFSRQVLDVSPDGKFIVFAATSTSSSADYELRLRPIGQFEARPLVGSESSGAIQQPLFSPDGQSLALYLTSERVWKRIAINGGPATTLARSTPPAGSSWGTAGILIGLPGAVQRINPAGGSPETLVALKTGEIAFHPEMLPGGRAVMFTLLNTATVIDEATARIVVQPLPSGERKTIAEGNDGRYMPTGHIVYALGGVLFARRFDVEHLEASGTPVPVVEGVWRGEGNVGLATAQYAVSQTGTLVYVPGPTGSAEYQRQLVSIDRDGKITPLKMRPGLYESPRISPDGSRVAVLMSAGNQSNVYVYDLTGGTTMRQLTFEGRNRFPIWTPDGKRIVFQSDRGGDLGIWWQQADGLGVAERLTKAENGAAHIPEAFVARTNTFSFSDVRSPNSVMLRLFSIDAHKTETFDDVRSTSPLDSDFSPDGQWVAYTVRGKDAGGVAGANVWVQPVPPTGAKYLVSSAGGHHPQWSADGTHLLYLPGADPLVTVTVTTRNGFAVGEPTPVPGGFASNTSSLSGRNHDLSRVGSFIVAALAAGGTRPQRIDVVLNWFTELQQRVPTR